MYTTQDSIFLPRNYSNWKKEYELCGLSVAPNGGFPRFALHCTFSFTPELTVRLGAAHSPDLLTASFSSPDSALRAWVRVGT